MELDKIGIHVCNSRFFSSFKKKWPQITSGRYIFLKEWEFIQASKHFRADISKLREYEKRLGSPYLWDALVCERRIYMGKHATITQDYKKRYSHERMLSMLQLGIERVEFFFNEIQPDFIVSFICVTLVGYLGYLVARKKGIPILNLRPTRIQNYIHAGDTVTWPSSVALETFGSFMEGNMDLTFQKAAIEYLNDFRSNNAKYEGVVPQSVISGKRTGLFAFKRIKVFFPKLLTFLIKAWRHLFGIHRDDNWVYGILWPHWFYKVHRPVRLKYIDIKLRKRYIRTDDLKNMDYAFFGLHVEPEVTLLVYSRPYINQIEAVRNISRSLPVGMKLVVKDHPLAIGKRPVSYYQKLLQIPNVVLLAPVVDSRMAIEQAKLIVSISGTIGFEGLMLKKPVITLGDCPFNCFGKSMLRNVRRVDELGYEIKDLLANYHFDENALICYIASLMATSVPVDFYSRLLGRHEFSLEDTVESRNETKRQFRMLAQYLKKQFELRTTRNALVENNTC